VSYTLVAPSLLSAQAGPGHTPKMTSPSTFAIAAALLALAAFAQWTIPQFTRDTRNAWALRALLALLGVVVGFTLMRVNDAAGSAALALFLLGFGLVHVPPALVLLLKRWRGERPS
jgi:hypothetical protein